MFDLLIDKKKKNNKKMSSMNKSCEKKQQHSQNILHVDVLYNIKRKKYICIWFLIKISFSGIRFMLSDGKKQ